MKNGNRLRVLRAERKLNQYDAALMAGIGPNRYWRIETGYAQPNTTERKSLAKVFGVKVSEVFPPEGVGA